MKIIATQEFLRGRVRLIPGAGYEMSDKEAWQLMGFGIVREAAPEEIDGINFTAVADAELGSDAPAPPGENVTLDVQDVGISTNAPNINAG